MQYNELRYNNQALVNDKDDDVNKRIWM